MARISTYPKDTNISLTDKLLGSDADNSLSTKQFEITDVVSFLRTQNIGSQGPQGPQGVQGNTGAAGAVGPAGLTWQGAWVSGTSYVADDAIGYGGASWFCILATSGTTTPDLDTTHWALLASQGATGPAGVAGPTGAQGPSGTTTYTEESQNTNSSSVAGNPANSTSKITKNFTRAYVTSAIDNFLGLSNIGKVTGDFFVVQNKSTTLDLVIIPIDYARFLQPNGFSSQINFTLGPNRYARFTLTDATSGSDKVFMVEVINPLGAISPYLESSFKVVQGGPFNPTVTNYFIDQVRISPSDNSNPLYRSLTFERTATGQFNIKILWLTGSTSAVNVTKVDMSVADGNIKFTSSSNGSFGPYSYFQQDINVYNASGTLSDDEFNTNFYIRLFL